MRPLPQPEPKPAPGPDRAVVLKLVSEAAAAHNAGEDMHRHPALEALSDLFGISGYYILVKYPADNRIRAADIDELTDGLLSRERHAQHYEVNAYRRAALDRHGRP